MKLKNPSENTVGFVLSLLEKNVLKRIPNFINYESFSQEYQ